MENIKDPILQIKDVCISYTSDVMAVKHEIGRAHV